MLKRFYIFLFVYDLLDTAPQVVAAKVEPLKRKIMNDLSRLTLFAYTLLIFNPAMPVVADKIAHTFWKEYHLITVHGVYGNRHVDTEITKATKQVADKDKSSRPVSGDHYPITTLVISNVVVCHFTAQAYKPYLFATAITCLNTLYQPPRA